LNDSIRISSMSNTTSIVQMEADGFVYGYLKEWAYDLVWSKLEEAYEAEGRAHKLSESVIEAGEGPSMRDIHQFVTVQQAQYALRNEQSRIYTPIRSKSISP